MRTLPFLLAAMIGCLLASAADRELDGRVVDANTGEPIQHAHITLRFYQAAQPAPEVTLLSDADGSFKVTNLPAGNYQVSCDKAGYLPANQSMGAMPLPTSGDPKPATMVLKMTAQAAVEGTVIDDRDMPAPNTYVQVVRQQVVNGRRQLQIMGSAATDETGYFRIFGLPAGQYYVSITARLNGSRRSKPLAYPPLFYPGALDIATAQPLDLKAGDDTEIKMRLPEPVRAFEVSGVVATASQYAGISLTAQPSANAGFRQSSGDLKWDAKTHTFRFSHVTPGMYQVSASLPVEGRLGSSNASVMVTVGSTDVTGIRLEPVEASLDGTVRVEGDAPPKMSGFISVQSERWSNGGQVDAEGKFHIPGIPPGTYRIVPQVFPQQSCVHSILSGGRDVRDALTVGSGASPEPVEVVLSTHCGSLDVSVSPSDTPLPPNLMAYLLRKVGDEMVLEKQGYQGPRSGDGALHLTVSGVAAGDYVVYVWPQDLPIEYTNAEYMKQFDSYGQKVTVTEDGKATVTVDKVLSALPKN